MKDLTQGNIYKNFIVFAIPMILAALLSQAHASIDTIIAGKFLGSNGLGAIGATAAFISFASSLFWGFASGSSIYTAALFGAQDFPSIKSSIYHSLGITALISCAFSLLIILFCDPILKLLQVDPAIFNDAKAYLVIYMLGLYIILLNNNFVHIMNAFGMSSFPFLMSLTSAVLNIAGNILAVAVFRLGVAGVAAATVLSALIVDIFYFIKLNKCFCEMNVKSTKVKFSKDIISKISTYGIPAALQQSIMYTSSMLVSPLINAIGSGASAGYAVALRIYEISASIYQNSTKTLSNYAAHCKGSRKPVSYFRKGVRVGLLQAIMFVSVPLFVCVFFSEDVCGLFFPSGQTGDGLYYAIMFSQIYLPFILFNLVNNLFHGFYRGIGFMKLLVILTAIGGVSRVIFTYILARYGMHGIYGGWALSWVTEAIIAAITYFMGTWKKTCIISPVEK